MEHGKGGIVLGPSVIGRNKSFMHIVFPSWSTPILESVASIGLLFYLFLVGLELDLRTIRRSGKRAFNIAVAGISLPFLFAVGVTFLLPKVIHFENHKVGFLQRFIFLGVSLSITAFPVLARILAELKLLTTQVGETAMAAAAFNDVAAWVLLALAVALTGGGHKNSVLTSIWVLFSGVAFVAFMLFLIRPMMHRIARQCSREHDVLDETYICLTLAGVMLSGFVTDLIGIHSIFGAFIFGLTIPKGGEFANRVTRRTEDFVSTLLLPLYFASSGLKTDVAKLQGVVEWELLLLVISTACAGKILGTFVVAVMCMIPVRESLTLGVLMNTKGLVELIVLNIGKEKKVLNDEMFTILVLMAIFTTFITTPMVLAIHKPSRSVNSLTRHALLPRPPPLTDLQEKLRILACIHGPSNVPSLINFIESLRATKESQLKLYVMQLSELTDSSSSILMVQRSRKNGFPFYRFQRGALREQIATAFQAFGQVGLVNVHQLTSISLLSSMHEDICHVAEKKGVAMIILPFHKRWRREDEEANNIEDIGNGWREVNQRVLQRAHCSVALLVNRGVGRCEERGESSGVDGKRVCMIFIGGPDDRKVLELGSRMAEHPAVRLDLVRFTSSGKEGKDKRGNHKSSTSDNNWEKEKELDEVAVNDFKTKWLGTVEYIEKDTRNITEEVLTIGKANEYELVIVGKGQQLLGSTTMVTNINDSRHEYAELGPIGDLLTCSDHGIKSSVLVIQDHDLINSNETSLEKTARAKSNVMNDAISEIETSV
ncbi:cation/H(+) antiporter 20-like isoform X2 [Gastrolobium bilobum]|uniref:cation/H(+) antiporter 20-like isoform X2 n=1 Tax=Gastrolobium bilobum TaxID=150636 RepID=UPI002AAF5D3E|nr:cation/H(+) antiporter 20-like isoform X2 [Gastrolobium bilobum]